jgi:hypothetical protein
MRALVATICGIEVNFPQRLPPLSTELCPLADEGTDEIFKFSVSEIENNERISLH